MKMNAIHWPEGFIPGLTDNFCSNEVIVTDLTPEAVWPLLATPLAGLNIMLIPLTHIFMTIKGQYWSRTCVSALRLLASGLRQR